MPWTAPRTWDIGELVTAALMNEQLRDNLLWLAGIRIARATQNPGVNTNSTTMVDSGLQVEITTTVTCTMIAIATYTEKTTNASYEGRVRIVRGAVVWSLSGGSNRTAFGRGAIDGLEASVPAGTHTIKVQYSIENATASIDMKQASLVVLAIPEFA